MCLNWVSHLVAAALLISAAVPQPSAAVSQPSAAVSQPSAAVSQPSAAVPQPSAAVSQPSAAVKVTVSPGVLSKSGDITRITWTGVSSPSDFDWLGIYSPANSSSDHFIGYIFLSTFPTWLSGSGSLTIPLVNLRSDYQFRVFRWSREEVDHSHHDHDGNPLPVTRHLLAESDPIRFGSTHGPEQIHLAYTGRPDEMRVMFVTGDGDVRYVRYGVREDEMKEIETALVITYGRGDMCDSPANESLGWRNPGFIHDGVMRNLKGGKRYYYQVGSDERGWSGAHSFIPHSGDETVAFLFGDMGVATPYSTFVRTQHESISTVRWILRDINALGDRPALVSHIGDISYARGYSWLWDAFFTQIEPISSRVPYHVCIGNHEYDWPLQPWRPEWSTRSYGRDGGGECGVPYSLRFHMPGNSSEPTGTGAPDTRNLYYSFDSGPVHFVYISTETNFLPGSPQYRFLDRDLGAVDRTRTPFVVVQGHRPMYTTSNEYRDAALRERMLGSLEPILVRENVTLALWGHVHRYERFCRLEKYVCGGGRGPVHVVIGMGGQDWQSSWEPRKDHPEDPIFPQPEMSMFRGGEFGYVRLVASREKLGLYYVGNHDGEVHDSVEISASGRVLGGGELKTKEIFWEEGVGEPWLDRYAMGATLLVLGMVAGFLLGLLKAKRGRNGWDRVGGGEVY